MSISIERLQEKLMENRVYIAVFLLIIFPLIVWALMVPFGSRWADGVTTLLSLGQITGILGLVLFSFSLAISARFRLIERFLGPLNHVYMAHHLIGTFALLALLTHPIFLLIYSVMIRKPNISALIIPGLDNALTWGILSLWSMAFLLVLTLYLRPRYALWRQTHKFLGLSLFLAGLHSLFIQSDISRSMLLRGYLLGLTLGSLLLFVAYTIFNRWTVRRYFYRLVRVAKLSDQMLTVELEPTGKSLSAQPGQFIFLRFKIDGRWSEAHPFSLTSQGGAKVLSVSMKVLGDDTARFISSLKVGMEAEVEGPFGTFGQAMNDAPRVICLAGGIGITPFISLLSSLPNTLPVEVYYCVPTAKDAVHLPQLEALSTSRGALTRIIPWYTQERSYLDAPAIQKTSVLNTADQVFLCGPPAMMRALRSGLCQAGLQNSQIHSEEFSFND